MMEKNYEHVVQYYETDAMQIVHHSNYIRWFEEARTWWLSESGMAYHRLEEMGIMMPILSVNAKYQQMMRFGDIATIHLKITKLTPVKMVISYWVYNKQTEELCVTGDSLLGFLDRATGKPVSMKKSYPELYESLGQHTMKS
ncbi:acyl-CoA thioesterase [Aerococcaceae bacterium DSM 111176]|nr:acyl-CoA thioesterase [Aerococcaceae bacterium DSM 111176]